MKANYEEDKVIVSATEPTGVNRKKVWFKKGKNLFDKTNYIIDSAGKIGFVLDLEKGETYTISSNLPLYVAKFAFLLTHLIRGATAKKHYRLAVFPFPYEMDNIFYHNYNHNYAIFSSEPRYIFPIISASPK